MSVSKGLVPVCTPVRYQVLEFEYTWLVAATESSTPQIPASYASITGVWDFEDSMPALPDDSSVTKYEASIKRRLMDGWPFTGITIGIGELIS